MSRVFAGLLGTDELRLRQLVMQLEAASGHTSHDIRLTSEIEQGIQVKLRELGLDPYDTRGEELYGALQQRFKRDAEQLAVHLTGAYPLLPPHVRVARMISTVPIPKAAFVLKTSIARRLLKQHPPKIVLKLLGYRSADACLRREPVGAVLAASEMIEPAAWQKQMHVFYRQLHAADMELRPLAIVAPEASAWSAVTDTLQVRGELTVLSSRVFGAVVILPFQHDDTAAMSLAATVLALHDLNTVRAAAVYLKLHQVQPDFGTTLAQVAAADPQLPAGLLGGQVSWQLIQRSHARWPERFPEALFAPHITMDDMVWHSVEKVLAMIEPRLDFWQRTASLGVLHGRRAVSLNLVDTALSYCHGLGYAGRMTHYLHAQVWSELLMRYLQHDQVERAWLEPAEAALAPAV